MNHQLNDFSIAEYILYLWQTEDLLRTLDFDIDKIDANVISHFPENERNEMRQWYQEIIDMMLSEGIKQTGHLQIANIRVEELDELHHALLIDPKNIEYTAPYYKALPFIAELRVKENNPTASDVLVCLQFLYGILMLRLQKKKLSEGTQLALTAITKLIKTLAEHHAQLRKSDDDTTPLA